MPHSTQAETLTIAQEVQATQEVLRSRLAGAIDISSAPPGVSEDSLPSVPLIDLAPSFSSDLADRVWVAEQIREACVASGFFQIANHGVTQAAMGGVIEQARRFFGDLTAAQKDELHIRHSELFRGYEAGGDTYVNPDDNDGANETETKEGFNWGYEPSLDPTADPATSASYVELDGKPPSAPSRCNVWPSPTLLPSFKQEISTYYTQVLHLARHLFRLFALSLSLPESYFDSLTTHPGGIARLLHYPRQSAAQLAHKNNSKLGLGAHTDYECFTLLLSTPHPGLEILFPPCPATHNRPLWRACPVRPGTLTVNVADFLMRWTNGLYKSTIHRVVSRAVPVPVPVMDRDHEQEGGPPTATETEGGVIWQDSPERYSVPFFFSINYDADVDPLPEHAVGVSRFQRLKAGEYVLERLRATV